MLRAVPKPRRIKDEAYKQWVIRLPCCASGGFGYDPDTRKRINDPHHVNDKTGGSAKFNDHRCIPLTHKLHDEVHRSGQKTFAAKYGLDYEILIAAYNRLYEEQGGILNGS
jgi:hypothetical protein